MFAGLSKDGLGYPYGTLHIVEVPSYLRVYDGSLRLGAANSPPGTVELLAFQAANRSGTPRLAAVVHIRNNEAAVGFLRLSTSPFEPDRHFEPITVRGHAGIEATLLFDQIPVDIWVMPYLSLNRFPIHLAMPSAMEQPTDRGVGSPQPTASRQTVRPSSWMPPPAKHVVVDDLDPGFRFERESNWRRRLFDRDLDRRELDNGLPIQPRRAGVWGRRDILRRGGHTAVLRLHRFPELAKSRPSFARDSRQRATGSWISSSLPDAST